MAVENILSKEAERAVAIGHTPITSFDGGVKNLDATYFEEGTIIHFPDEITTSNAFSYKIGNATVQYLICACTKADGTEGVVNVYTTTFSKSRDSYKEPKPGDVGITKIMENGKPVRVSTSGSATELFHTKAKNDDAMRLLLGKDVLVSKDTKIWAKVYGKNEVAETHIYKLDLVTKPTK